MQTLEFAILDWIQNTLRCDLLDITLPFVSALCDHGEIWIILALVLLAIRQTRLQGAAVACGLALDLIACNLLLKPLFGRVRPFVLNPACWSRRRWTPPFPQATQPPPLPPSPH